MPRVKVSIRQPRTSDDLASPLRFRYVRYNLGPDAAERQELEDDGHSPGVQLERLQERSLVSAS
jgi:hypothetical protein